MLSVLFINYTFVYLNNNLNNKDMKTTTNTIETNSTIEHKSEMFNGHKLTAKVLAIAYLKQNACIQFEDGYIQMMDIEEIEASYNVK